MDRFDAEMGTNNFFFFFNLYRLPVAVWVNNFIGKILHFLLRFLHLEKRLRGKNCSEQIISVN